MATASVNGAKETTPIRRFEVAVEEGSAPAVVRYFTRTGTLLCVDDQSSECSHIKELVLSGVLTSSPVAEGHTT